MFSKIFSKASRKALLKSYTVEEVVKHLLAQPPVTCIQPALKYYNYYCVLMPTGKPCLKDALFIPLTICNVSILFQSLTLFRCAREFLWTQIQETTTDPSNMNGGFANEEICAVTSVPDSKAGSMGIDASGYHCYCIYRVFCQHYLAVVWMSHSNKHILKLQF